MACPFQAATKVSPVTLYFFNVINHINTQDEVGTELANLESARAEALKDTIDIKCSRSAALGNHWQEWSIEVCNNKGDPLREGISGSLPSRVPTAPSRPMAAISIASPVGKVASMEIMPLRGKYACVIRSPGCCRITFCSRRISVK
jgi:hypothetical protein